MISEIILRMSSIISTISEGKRLIVSRNKNKIISSASKCRINEVNKNRKFDRCENIQVVNKNNFPKVKKRIKKIEN